MGAGCLKPQPRMGQIYIDCINQIYQQVHLIDTNIKSNLYETVKQKISKKGWLRKLMDYLTSHRSSIPEAALHNFRLMVQSKGIQYKVTGLVVMDFIINSILRESNQSQQALIDQLKQKNLNTALSQYEQSQIKNYHNFPSSKSMNNIQFQQQQKSRQKIKIKQFISPAFLNNNSQYQSKINNYSLMLRQIYNVKFSHIFFSMIHSLLSEDILYRQILLSLTKYLNFDHVKNTQQQKIIQILNILLQHIQNNQQVKLSLLSYSLLIPKLKDNFLDKQVQVLKVFFQIWEQNYDEHKINKINKMKKQLDNPDSKRSIINSNDTSSDIKSLIQIIIKKMIGNMIGSSTINKMYEQIIYVYDLHKFQQMTKFQQMIISIAQKQDLKNQFLRGLYCYLLAYFAVCRGGQTHSLTAMNFGQNLASALLTNWTNLSVNKSYESFINDYINILDIKTKSSVIQTLKRWIIKFKFVSIDQLLKYNSSLFFNSFQFNIHSNIQNNKQFAKFTIIQFINLCHDAQIQQKITIINLFFDRIKSNQIQNYQKILFLSSITKILPQEPIQAQKDHKSIQFCPCLQVSIQINCQLINQVMQITKKLTEKMFGFQIQQYSYFLYSIFQVLHKTQQYTPQQFVMFNQSIIDLLRTLQESQGCLLLLAFCQRITKAVTYQIRILNLFFYWDLILNCVYICLRYPSYKQKEQHKKQINQVYLNLMKIQNLKKQANKINAKQFQQKCNCILQQSLKLDLSPQMKNNKLSAINQPIIFDIFLPRPHQYETSSYTINQKIYQISSIAFRNVFSQGVSYANGFIKENKQQDQNHYIHNNSHSHGFSRVESIVLDDHLQMQGKSIADVMDMIDN